MTMTHEQKQKVAHVIDSENFHYCFIYYSNFTQITDPEFHKLRKAYIAAADALEAFIGQVEEAEEEE